MYLFVLASLHFFFSALARRASDNSNSGRQPAEADPNKRKIIRKAKGGIKVPSSDLKARVGTMSELQETAPTHV